MYRLSCYLWDKAIISATQGKADHGTQYQVQKAYEHNLKRTAYNFCFGSFGGVKGTLFKFFSFLTFHILTNF